MCAASPEKIQNWYEINLCPAVSVTDLQISHHGVITQALLHHALSVVYISHLLHESTLVSSSQADPNALEK